MSDNRNQRGFTLIEVLVAITILAVVVLSMFAIYLHAIREIRRAKNRTFATNANQMILDRIVMTPFDARRYHEASTTSDINSLDQNIRNDIFDWAAMLKQFPVRAVGTITVRVEDRCLLELTPPYCPKVLIVVAAIRYQDYGRERTQIASLYVEPREAL